MADIAHLLHQWHASATVLDDRVVRREQAKWRETFGKGVKESTGKWTYKGIDWHAFSFRFAPCLKGPKAETAFNGIASAPVILLVSHPQTHGFQCAGKIPSLDNLRRLLTTSKLPIDIYLSPPDYEWTMVLTHEDQNGTGPFFAMKAWQNLEDLLLPARSSTLDVPLRR